MNINNSAIINREERQLPIFSNNSINYEEAFRNTNNKFRSTNRGFSAKRPNLNSEISKPFKDPEIWESPPPIEKRQSHVKVNKPAINNKNHQIRNIPQKKKDGKDNNGKKTFLNDRYPEGSGPDTNLIEMLER